jgi:hypothetical protein
MPIELVTMDMVYIPHRPYAAPDCDNSIERLVVHAAGDAATSAFLCWTGTGLTDDQLSRNRLRALGAGFFQRRWLTREAREAAVRRVWALKTEIFSVAEALRERRVLSQVQIETLV